MSAGSAPAPRGSRRARGRGSRGGARRRSRVRGRRAVAPLAAHAFVGFRLVRRPRGGRVEQLLLGADRARASAPSTARATSTSCAPGRGGGSNRCGRPFLRSVRRRLGYRGISGPASSHGERNAPAAAKTPAGSCQTVAKRAVSAPLDAGLRNAKGPVPGLSSRVADGIRTRDHRDHNPGLYQLSYRHRELAQDSRGRGATF